MMQNLSGLWQGQFSYPRTFQAEFFTASLLEQAGMLSGTITEKAVNQADVSGVFLAYVNGQHDGATVHFLKRYESATRTHTVHYTGQVNSDSTEISGVWSIPGNWSGPFLMVRAQPEQQRAVHRQTEQVE
ncbi:hypothetical protein [Acetobacter cibinongensis]|uniref:hypothetical protein n=1 Tax=Acetobacter cibinongensis TaxID=146475 RepID=UPI000A39B0AC|nr:hypothetical protein [Acetobacter cibinongensis]